MNHKKHFTIATLIMLVVSVIAYYGINIIYVLPEQASQEAVVIDALFKGHFMLISFLFALVVSFMGYALYTFRRKEGEEGDGEYIHGNTKLEIVWTVIPLGFVLFFGNWGWQAFSTLIEEKPNERVVDIYGQQWSWSFHYSEYGEFANSSDLVLEVGQPVLLNMEARDVIHSFWVPEFRIKQDLIPNRKTTLHLTPTKVGSYRLRCAEMCGTLHSQMMADVLVLDSASYAEWESSIQALASASPAEYGQVVWESSCKACHSLDGSAGVGPSWQGLFGKEEALEGGTTVTVDEAYLQTAICDPSDTIVEGFSDSMTKNLCDGTLSENDLDSVIQFIVYLSENGEPFPEE